jgi:succinyl-CoA synthetase alpha subunit
MIGEIGGVQEEDAAEFVKKMSKPVVAYIAGKAAPMERKMGHAGALVEEGRGTATSKIEALLDAGAQVAESPEMIDKLVKAFLLKT